MLNHTRNMQKKFLSLWCKFMLDMIIDMHSHLGNNLYHNGGEIIEKKGIKKKLVFDPISISEFVLHRLTGLEGILYRWIENASRERIKTATRENTRKSMDEVGVTYAVCLPMSLNFVTFQELKSASDKDNGIIPFTGVDHTKQYDFDQAYAEDVASGAKGLKLHPVTELFMSVKQGIYLPAWTITANPHVSENTM